VHSDFPNELYIKSLHSTATIDWPEYSETTVHFNGNFDTDNQIYVP
jgi:hypothetical protein